MVDAKGYSDACVVEMWYSVRQSLVKMGRVFVCKLECLCTYHVGRENQITAVIMEQFGP